MEVRLPIIEGLIRRRILVNFRVDPIVLMPTLPAPFRPKLIQGLAIVGICLIRLEDIRPRGLPSALGLSSENAAHRIAVTWTDADGTEKEGVYIPRRDTSSWLNHLAGGRLFPGEHHRAAFTVRDEAEGLELQMQSADNSTTIELRAKPAAALPPASGFRTLDEASAFFRGGSLGYSETARRHHLDGVSLVTRDWQVAPLEVTHVASSFFADERRFPPGSVTFDCALIMRNLPHEWHAAPNLALVA